MITNYCPIAYVKLDILLKYILQPMSSSVGPHFGNALLCAGQARATKKNAPADRSSTADLLGTTADQGYAVSITQMIICVVDN